MQIIFIFKLKNTHRVQNSTKTSMYGECDPDRSRPYAHKTVHINEFITFGVIINADGQTKEHTQNITSLAETNSKIISQL